MTSGVYILEVVFFKTQLRDESNKHHKAIIDGVSQISIILCIKFAARGLGKFVEGQFAETQFSEREGQLANFFSANCPFVVAEFCWTFCRIPSVLKYQCFRPSDMPPFPLVPLGPLGRLSSHLAKRGRTAAKT